MLCSCCNYVITFCALFGVVCDHMISPCYDENGQSVCVAASCLKCVYFPKVRYLRLFRLIEETYNLSFEPDRA